MANNHSRLIAESEMLDVIYARGYRTTPKGRYTFLFCPEHESKYEGTNHPQSNCFTRRGQNYCYCKVCMRKFNTKEYLELKENVSFGEAYDMLYEIMGCPSYYKDMNSKPMNPEERKKQENLIYLDNFLKLRFIGLEKYLSKQEKSDIRETTRNIVGKRMTYLEGLLGNDVFKEERDRGI